MPTLITVGNSDGERRCDAKCYDADGGVCNCCCGGMNHGKGLSVAMDNVEKYGKAVLEKIKKENPGMKTTIESIQLSIWGKE
jgi:hypothetical protein